MSRRSSLSKVFRTVKHKWWYRHIKAIILSCLSLCFILAGIAAIWVANLQIPDLSAFETRKVDQSTKIYDRTGQILLYDIHDDVKRTVVPFSDISQNLKDATVAIEDADFYHHFGIKPLSILRAGIADIFSGGYSQGGSTITQQVIKNSLLTQDKTLTRKIKEWVLAIKLERVLTKDEILSTYLNETAYGGNIYGVEEASKAFFGTDASDLTLAEAAYIAALPQAPSYYSPYGTHLADLDTRQKLVLKQMLNNKFITQDQYNQAITEKVQFLPKDTGNIRAPHFSLYVRDYLENKYGESTVLDGGLKVITTLDYTMQQEMEQVVSTFGPQIANQYGASNTAMVAIDPKTGDILAMVGSRDYYDNSIDGNFNIATAYRQPGSTFKPFVYATAFEKGYTPDTILFDVPTEFSTSCTVDGKPKDPSMASTTCYSPDEYDGIWDGPLTMRQALAQSRNIPAVKTLYLAGIPDSIKTAQDMGITSLTDPSRYGLTLVLGGGEVSLLDMTSAYGVFANDGVRTPYRSVLSVEDSNGNTLEESTTSPVQVIPAQIARQINDILSDPSPGVRMDSITQITNPLKRPVAVKTGTTNDYKDVWVLGYTPNLVIGAWAGRNDDTSMAQKVAGLIITPLWGALMSKVLPSLPVENFKAPDPAPSDLKPVMRGIWQGGVSYKIDTVSGKVATQYTPLELQKEIVFPDPHSILYWVDKDNPRGPVPANPQNDPQFSYWEYGVQNWLATYEKTHPDFKITTSFAVPTATDDVHTPENAPQVAIASSTGSAFDMNKRVTVNLTVAGKYPIVKSELYINDKYILENTSNPLQINFTPEDIDGIEPTDTLKVIVYDSVLNQSQTSMNFTVNQ